VARAKILIVEDDFLGAERARLLLEGAGYDVVGLAPRTDDALRLAQEHAPDLAIVDLMLEIDVDGLHTATELARRHDLKIVIATGFPDTVVAHETVRDLGCALVRKPYTDDELLSAVAACLATGAS
jgi:DNA-binding response OmpR family regulator